MNRFQIVLTTCVFTAAAAWGQATNSSTPQAAQPGNPAPSTSQAQPAQPAQAGQTANSTTGTTPQTSAPAAASAKNEISGCMTRGFANYQLSDSATQAKYQIRGNGAELDQHANKVVQIQGVPDPKDSQGGKTIFYASTVKDSGQTCGTPDQMATNGAPAQPGAAAATSSQTASNAAASNTAMTGANSQASTATPNAQAGSPAAAVGAGQTSANVSTSSSAQPSADATGVPANTQSTASTQQGGTAGVAANATQSQAATTEDKGTPQAGTPQTGAVGAPAASSSTTDTASSQAASAGQTFQGCVSGDPNNLKFKSSGKDYRLQGDTRAVWKLIGHNVEVTGEDFGGKAIQISGTAKDLGSCKK